MEALKQAKNAEARAEMIKFLIAQAREDGIQAMTDFFLDIHKTFAEWTGFVENPEMDALGRELLERLTQGENIDLAVIHAAMSRNGHLHQEALAVPLECYRDDIPTLWSSWKQTISRWMKLH